MSVFVIYPFIPSHLQSSAIGAIFSGWETSVTYVQKKMLGIWAIFIDRGKSWANVPKMVCESHFENN